MHFLRLFCNANLTASQQQQRPPSPRPAPSFQSPSNAQSTSPPSNLTPAGTSLSRSGDSDLSNQILAYLEVSSFFIPPFWLAETRDCQRHQWRAWEAAAPRAAPVRHAPTPQRRGRAGLHGALLSAQVASQGAPAISLLPCPRSFAGFSTASVQRYLLAGMARGLSARMAPPQSRQRSLSNAYANHEGVPLVGPFYFILGLILSLAVDLYDITTESGRSKSELSMKYVRELFIYSKVTLKFTNYKFFFE